MHRRTTVSLGAGVAALALVLTACGGSSGANGSQIASIEDSRTADSNVTTTTTVSFQDALVQMSACLREQGLDVDDPTFDANGNPTGGFIIGPDSGLDPGSDEFRTAMDACQSIMEGVRPPDGATGARMLNLDEVQASLNEFTECLRDEGLEVDDIEFGPPGEGPVTRQDGDESAAGDNTTQTSIVNGPPPGGGPTGGFAVPIGPGNGAGAVEGFDPTERIIEQLELDEDDPAVTAAIDACNPILESAFEPESSTDTTGE
jgi:hypothetical protein